MEITPTTKTPLAEPLAPPPVPLLQQLDELSTPLDPPPLCGLPRRFSTRGILILTTLAAFLLDFLRECRATPSIYFIVMTFVAGTLAAQVVLFRGRKPIAAAMWAGAGLLPIETLALVIYWQSPSQSMSNKLDQFVVDSACMCIGLVPVGAILGAVAGAVGGGLYILSEEILLWSTRGMPRIALELIENADADVLLRWIRGPKFCRRWAGGQLTWPLDRQQLLARFASARGEQSVRHIYKAVDRRMGNMVGYVELGAIDLIARQAAIELPLINPGESERGRVSVLLLQAIGKRAFGNLGLLSITIAVGGSQSDLSLCCHEAWGATYKYHTLDDGDAVWTARRRGNAHKEVAGNIVPGDLQTRNTPSE